MTNALLTCSNYYYLARNYDYDLVSNSAHYQLINNYFVYIYPGELLITTVYRFIINVNYA